MRGVNKIVLGTVQFGLKYGINNSSGKPGQSTINSILDHAFSNGITLLDTAEAYGDSHEAIGRYHAASPNRFSVITKFAHNRKDLPVRLADRIAANARALSVEALYGYMFHSYADFKSYFETYRSELRDAKTNKTIHKFGVSVYTNDEALAVLDNDEVDFIQLPFNLLDNIKQRGIVLDLAQQRNVEVHTRSAFLQGLFFKEVSKLPAGFQPLLSSLGEIRSIATRNSVDLSTLSLQYAIQQPKVNFVLIGVDNVSQLKENIHAVNRDLPLNVITEVNSIEVTDVSLLNPSTWQTLR